MAAKRLVHHFGKRFLQRQPKSEAKEMKDGGSLLEFYKRIRQTLAAKISRDSPISSLDATSCFVKFLKDTQMRKAGQR